MTRRVVVLELNEVPWRIVDLYVAANPRSTLAQLLEGSWQFRTTTADVGHLSPWTTWPTVHRGVNDEQHLIGSFGQDVATTDASYPPIWQLLHRAGVSIGVCGTLHSHPVPADLGPHDFYVPDAFAPDASTYPESLEAFQEFNLAMSRRSERNVDTGVPRDEARRFITRCLSMGIRPATLAALARQLADERRVPGRTTRRRTYQALLGFDVFDAQLGRRESEYATFFTNHVASAMHRYWAAMLPGDYAEMNLPEDWLDRYRDEIPWAMSQADAMIARLVERVRREADSQLWIMSSMGQGPTLAQELETQLYLTNLGAFMDAIDVVPRGKWEERASMAPQRNVYVDAAYADRFAAALDTIVVADQPLKYERRADGLVSMWWGHSNLYDRPDALTVGGEPREVEAYGLANVEIEDRSDTTAYHVPEGILIVYDPHRRAPTSDRTEVSVLSITPALLQRFGVESPAYLQEAGQLRSVASSV